MASYILEKLFSEPDFTFRCQFLGTTEVTNSPLQVEAFLKDKARTAGLKAGGQMPYYELCISRTSVWIEQNISRVKYHFRYINRISFTTQDPDDKTVFGYVCRPVNPFESNNELYAFKSEEVEVIIKTLRKYIRPTTNIMTEAVGSLDGGNSIMSVENRYGLGVGSMVEVLTARGVLRFGVIRWVGNMPQVEKKLVAGLELEEKESGCSDGTFNKERYFTCPKGRGFFLLLENCRPDSRYANSTTTDVSLNAEKVSRNYRGHKFTAASGGFLERYGQLQEKNEETANLQNQASALRQQLEEKDQEINELETTLSTAQDELREHQRQLRDVTQQMTIVRGQLQEKNEETANLQNQATALRQQLEEKDQEMNELETTLSTAQDELREYQRQQSPEWIISRDHIQLTGRFLGRGGWGSVVEGKYCGCSVAVKQIHELILSPHNRNLFEREMDIASRCRHPCLLQFIGATNDEGNPLFITELMETSLRTLLEQRALSEAEMSFISLDVARALNYLHQKQPSPIIHRDISSANVLLWRQGEHWRGKVSDYGTANFMQQTMTVAPGAMIYSAPEALTKKQTVKVDVYSFGVLLCEMCIRELPDPIKRDRQVALVKNKLNRALIRKCLQREPEARPSIQEIIDELEEPV